MLFIHTDDLIRISHEKKMARKPQRNYMRVFVGNEVSQRTVVVSVKDIVISRI